MVFHWLKTWFYFIWLIFISTSKHLTVEFFSFSYTVCNWPLFFSWLAISVVQVGSQIFIWLIDWPVNSMHMGHLNTYYILLLLEKKNEHFIVVLGANSPQKEENGIHVWSLHVSIWSLIWKKQKSMSLFFNCFASVERKKKA